MPDRARQADPGSEAPPLGEAPRLEPPLLDQLIAVGEFRAIERPPDTLLWGPLAVGRRLVLASDSGAGKSTFGSQLMGAICFGDNMLGWVGVGDTRGLWLDVEQAPADTNLLIDRFDLGRRGIKILHQPDGWQFDREERLRVEFEEVLEAWRPGVVLADPLYKLFGGDSNDEKAVVNYMRIWDRWRAGMDMAGRVGRWPAFAMILPVHARKPQAQRNGRAAPFTMADIHGSGAWVRGAELVWGIQYLNPGFSKLHGWKDRGSRGAGLDPPFRRGDSFGLLYDDGRGFTRGPAGAGKPGTDQVLELLAQSPEGMTLEELQAGIPGRGPDGRASASTVKRYVRALGPVLEAVTVEDGEKIWRISADLPDDGDLDRWARAARAGPPAGAPGPDAPLA